MRNYSNMKTNNSTERINDICFKLFAPHLCPEPVTESKTALENKLYNQILKFGTYILKIEEDDCYEDEKSESIYMALAVCINKFRTKEITAEENFSAYFSTVLKNEYFRIIKEAKHHCSSLDIPVGEDEDFTIKDFIKDEKSLSVEEAYEEKETSTLVLRHLDICWKQAKFPEWYRAVITCDLYEVLHEIFCRYEINPERYSFIDMEIYNLNKKIKYKELAVMIGKNSSQISRANVCEKLKTRLRLLGLEFPL